MITIPHIIGRPYNERINPLAIDLRIPYGPREFVRYPCPKCARGDHSSHGPTCCREVNGIAPRDGVCSCKEGIKAPPTRAKKK